ncbi:MAG: AMP-binding protein [Treponema sp.]|nr:AMP-binding protein [Treponema sp.]
MLYLEKDTLAALVTGAARKYGALPALQIYRDGGVYGAVTYAAFARRAAQFALLLRGLGCGRGAKVLILSENRPEWAFAFFGAALAGAVAVPLLTGFSAAQVETIAAHCGAKAICCGAAGLEKAMAVGLSPIIKLDSLEGDRVSVILHGAEETMPLANEPQALETALREGDASCAPEDSASIIYTSGTTGRSKGVCLSHRNILFVARTSRALMKIYPRDRLLSLIPLAHAYECSLGLAAPLLSGASISYLDRAPAPAALLQAMQALRPTALVSVPLFIEKLCRARIFPRLEKNPLYRCPLTRILAIKLAGFRLIGALGGALRFFGVGGAPLAEDVERFLRTAGFPYSPGYGLTEAAPLVAGTAPYRFTRGSAGRILDGVQIRFVKGDGQAFDLADGEIQVKGPNVMQGYYHAEEMTREAFTSDGWLRTGDTGFIDKKGCLHIRGRVKDIILGPSGENIYPADIECILSASTLVEDALVVPGPRGELVALIVLSEKAQTAAAALSDRLEELRRKVNQNLASFSRLARIEVRDAPFEKTPTQKIRRFLYRPAEAGI